MAKSYVRGDAVENATSYELLEKTAEGVYNSLAEASEINFDLSTLELAAGDHTLVVKAKADGYEDSDYSNEEVYTVADAENLFNLNNVDQTLRYSPSSTNVKNNSGTAYALYVMEVEPNSTYSISNPSDTNVAGGGLFTAQPVKDSVATTTIGTITPGATVEVTTGADETWLAFNVTTNETADGSTTLTLIDGHKTITIYKTA